MPVPIGKRDSRADVPRADKVRYVLGQGQDRYHRCHFPGCNAQVAPARWGCRRCWMRLPKDLRDRIWAAYRPGQEKDMRPSREYLAVAEEVQEWITGWVSRNVPGAPGATSPGQAARGGG